MSIYIPILLLYIPLVIALWCAIGWVLRLAIFICLPGMQLGLPRGHQHLMVLMGPILIWWGFELVMDYYRAKRIRAEYKAEQERIEP